MTIDLGIPAENIIVSGDSAGGGLGMALLLYLRDHASPPLPMIGGGALLSPWVDLTSSLGSWDSNKVSPLPATMTAGFDLLLNSQAIA